jgi:Cd2+/Zn2+-exporting ATPase
MKEEVSWMNNSRQKGTKSIIKLERLGCAACAAKMEAEISRLEGVRVATVDFFTRRLTLETYAGDLSENLREQIEGIVQKIEPGVRVGFESGAPESLKEAVSDDEHNQRKRWAKLTAGGALFALGSILSLSPQLELAIFLVSYVIAGGDVLWRAVKGITSGQVFSEHFLMSIATIGAFLIGEYPEGVAVMLFYLVGEMLQDMAVGRSRRSISSLMDIRPDYANLKIGDELSKVSPEEVEAGDLIVVKPGEKIPLDGKVVEGISMVDTAALTGESIPRELAPGDEALSGFINKNGVLMVEVTKSYRESTVARILDLVQNAGSRKAPTENFITRFARYYTPIVVLGALALATIPPLLIQGATFADWIYRALVFLVVSCPCALVISIPLGFFGGIGGASKRGILVKGANYLEALNDVKTVVFDKTGTLTKGVFKVTQVNPSTGIDARKLLEWAAYAESYSNHPIALSLVSAFNAAIDQNLISNYREIAGNGIKAEVNGREVLVGNARLMESENISYSHVEAAGTVIHVAVEKQYAGSIVIADEIKEDSARAIRELKSLGIKKTVMLTGDMKKVGDRIGSQLGLDEVYPELLPADKVDKLEDIMDGNKLSKGRVVFVGDGINDAPVLARADIGMAMGGLGSDAAIEASDIVIMTDEPSKIASAIRIARRTKSIVYQNIVFALGVKALFLVLGAAGVATMWAAVFGDVGVALLAILNAMRVMYTRSI